MHTRACGRGGLELARVLLLDERLGEGGLA